MAKRIENWITVKWIGGKFDRVMYDINRRNINAKPPFKLGQIVELKSAENSIPGGNAKTS